VQSPLPDLETHIKDYSEYGWQKEQRDPDVLVAGNCTIKKNRDWARVDEKRQQRQGTHQRWTPMEFNFEMIPNGNQKNPVTV